MSAEPLETQPFRWPQGKRGAVSLTFDDARASQIDAGMAILDALGVKATFYASIGNLERRLAEWRKAAARGHEMGNHSLSHPCSGNFRFARNNALENYTLERMEADLLDANDQIRRLVGATPVTFAYPCGQTFVGRGEGTRSYVPLVARHFLVGRGAYNEAPNDPAFCDLAQAFGMEADRKSPDELKALAARAADEGGWLILFGHDVGEAGRHQVVPADSLRALCEYALEPANGIWIDTVAAVGTYIQNVRSDSSS
ncbi:MAG: hypothetical protein AMS14_04815 [Planctomycetes bacterium DG_20]|nr:MAG: hypothetical protein AMS14_04815 [Planctomycetes bacterium DG_20]